MTRSRRAILPLAGLVAALVAGACSIGGINTLGGREKCWPEADARIPSLMKGTLRLTGGFQLDTPEGEVLALAFPQHQVRTDAAPPALADAGGGVVAAEGDLVTLWGGLGADGSMAVCAVEERHAGS